MKTPRRFAGQCDRRKPTHRVCSVRVAASALWRPSRCVVRPCWRCRVGRALGVGRDALGVRRWALGVRRRALGVRRRVLGVGRRASGVGRRALGVGRRALGVGRRTLGVGRRALGVGRQALGVGRWASGVRRWATMMRTPLPHGCPSEGVAFPLIPDRFTFPGCRILQTLL